MSPPPPPPSSSSSSPASPPPPSPAPRIVVSRRVLGRPMPFLLLLLSALATTTSAFVMPASSSSTSVARRPLQRRAGLRFREAGIVVDDDDGGKVDERRMTTKTSDEGRPKKTLSVTLNVNPRVISTRKFDVNDIRITRATRATREEVDVVGGEGGGSGSENDDEGEDVVVVDSKSARRLLKARQLLEMAQISPSQRLENMRKREGGGGSEDIGGGGQKSGNNDIYGTTVVPMGGYSMRFGGYGSLEEELKDVKGLVVGMRMADTFDSVDNPVDSKSSLLPGGRWVNAKKTDDGGGGGVGVVGGGGKTRRRQQKRYDKTPGVGDVGYSGLESSYAYPSSSSSGGQVAEPLVRYDPVEAERLLFKQPAKWLVRNIQIALPLGLWVAGILLDVATGVELSNRTRRARELNSIIASLGPAIIKAGQALASRPDLLPGEYLEELQKLQDDVPTFGNDIAFRIVEEELNQKFVDVFELIEPEPVAAASIGQVYKGRLKSNGQVVAIKIQRPNTEEIVALDLYVLRWWGGVYNSIFRLLGRDINLQSVMDDFGTLLYGEIDYVAEAANARRFSELYAEDAIADVFVPKVYSELTTRKVLTMEWVDGFRLTDGESLEANNLDRKKLVDTLVQCSLRQIMGSGFFHADPHAGNLLATRDGRLCYLDFGMMSYADAAQRNGFLLAVVHIVNRDWEELVRVYQRLGFIPEGTDVRPIELALEKALPDVLSADISELNFKNVVGKLGDIMYTYPFSLPPFYISIIRCLGVLEGLAIQVDPKSRIISEAYPYVANRVLTDDSQEELREALRRLIFTADGHIRWSRLESLLDEAKESSGFDIVPAASKLVDFVISSEGGRLLDDIADQIVLEADSLGRDTVLYITNAFGVLAKADGHLATNALRSLVGNLQENKDDQLNKRKAGSDLPLSPTTAITKVLSSILETLPEATPSIQRTVKLGRVMGTRGASSLAATSSVNSAAAETVDTINKLMPLVRKLSQEPRVTSKASEVVARLSERLVSRGLRAAFGLPPPVFDTNSFSKGK